MILLTNGTPLAVEAFYCRAHDQRRFCTLFPTLMRNISEERRRFIKTRLLMSILTCFQWGKDKAPVQAVRLISKLCLTQRPLKVSQLSISNFINSPLSLHGRTRNNISRQSCSYQQQRTSECAIYTNLRQFMGLTPSPENMQYREAAGESRPIQRRSHDPACQTYAQWEGYCCKWIDGGVCASIQITSTWRKSENMR